MPSVSLVSPENVEIVVDTTTDFNRYVFGRGYVPLTGTVAENYEILLGTSNDTLIPATYLTVDAGDLRYVLQGTPGAYLTQADADARYLQITTGSSGGGTTDIVFHGADPNVARPAVSGPVLWLGTVDPVNSDDALDYTIYFNPDGGGSIGVGGVTISGIGDVPGLQTAIDAKANRQLTVVTVAGDYTLTAGDFTGDTILHGTATGNMTITAPADATIPLNVPLYWRQMNTGQFLFAAGTGVQPILSWPDTAKKSGGRYASGTLVRTSSTEFHLDGGISS